MTDVFMRMLWKGVLFCGIALIARLLWGPDAAMVLIIGLVLLILGRQALAAQRLKDWVGDMRLDNAPRLGDWWDELGSRIYRNLKLYERQQQMLSNSLLGFRNAAHALPDGVITVNPQLQINWCNETAETHFGLRSGRDSGQIITNLVRDPDFVGFIKARQAERPGLMRSPLDSKMILSLQLVHYGEDEILILSRDVTEREKLDRMRRDFVANVSHELKTPLTVLLGFLETVRELELPPEEVERFMDMMDEQGRRMRTLIEDLLALSALESPVIHAPDEKIRIGQLTKRLKTDAEALSGGRHSLHFDIADHIDLRGRESEITSAFSNLISNAIRYTPDGGRISVRWYDDGEGELRFEVSDSGIGIPAEHLPRLSERFYRVDRSRSRETGGTGLGLAIVKHVLTRHQGRLDIQSEVGKGSTFTAVLPASRRLNPLPVLAIGGKAA